MKNKNLYQDTNKLNIPKWEELPNIGLYVDQVVGIIEEHLKHFFKDETDKIVTKSMINNYVKHNIIKPPVNKKYDKENMAELFILCVLKKIYSINEIAYITNNLKEDNSIDKVYNQFCTSLENSINYIFNNEKNDTLLNQNQLLKHIVLSFANYLYVKKHYFNNTKNS